MNLDLRPLFLEPFNPDAGCAAMFICAFIGILFYVWDSTSPRSQR